MSAMPSPKSPLPLLAVAGVLYLLTQRKASAATTAPAAVKGQTTGQSYADPVAVAGTLARSVLQVVKGLNNPKPATDPRPYADGTTDAARAAVRAGDASYGQGALAWFDRTGSGAGFPADPSADIPGWTMPKAIGINPAAAAAVYSTGDPYNPQWLSDAVPAAPVFSPATDVAWADSFRSSWGFLP